MKRTPQISSIFCLTKGDANDFEREAITRQLRVTPTETCGPMVSPGRIINGDGAMYDLPGLTPVGHDGRFVKHAFWSVDIPKISCWSIDEPLQKSIFNGRESFVRTACLQNDLCAKLIIRIFADANNMPEVTLSSKSILFWASMGADIDFNFIWISGTFMRLCCG